MSVTSANFTAKEAIKAAFGHFDELFEDAKIENVLLEGVSFIEGENVWKVSIGFDAGRRRISSPAQASLFGQGMEPVREIRRLYVADDTGELKRMD
jgi:hypothetical protein